MEIKEEAPVDLLSGNYQSEETAHAEEHYGEDALVPAYKTDFGADLLDGIQHEEEQEKVEPKQKAKELAEDIDNLSKEFDENEEKIKVHVEVPFRFWVS